MSQEQRYSVHRRLGVPQWPHQSTNNHHSLQFAGQSRIMYLDCYSCGCSIESGGVTPQAQCECGEPLWIRTESSKADADVNLSLSSVDLDDRM